MEKMEAFKIGEENRRVEKLHTNSTTVEKAPQSAEPLTQ